MAATGNNLPGQADDVSNGSLADAVAFLSYAPMLSPSDHPSPRGEKSASFSDAELKEPEMSSDRRSSIDDKAAIALSSWNLVFSGISLIQRAHDERWRFLNNTIDSMIEHWDDLVENRLSEMPKAKDFFMVEEDGLDELPNASVLRAKKPLLVHWVQQSSEYAKKGSTSNRELLRREYETLTSAIRDEIYSRTVLIDTACKNDRKLYQKELNQIGKCLNILIKERGRLECIEKKSGIPDKHRIDALNATIGEIEAAWDEFALSHKRKYAKQLAQDLPIIPGFEVAQVVETFLNKVRVSVKTNIIDNAPLNKHRNGATWWIKGALNILLGISCLGVAPFLFFGGIKKMATGRWTFQMDTDAHTKSTEAYNEVKSITLSSRARLGRPIILM